VNSRERTIRSIRFESPDRVPVLHRIKPGFIRLHTREIRELRQKYPSDILQSEQTHTWFTFSSSGKLNREPGKLVTDEWGCVWKTTTSDHLGQVVDSPLKEWADFRNYAFPDPSYGIEGIRYMAEVRKEDGRQRYMMVSIGSIFHMYTYLRGYENALVDVAEQPGELFTLLEKLTEFAIRRIKLLADYDLDGIFIADDWGTQSNMLIDPEQWRRIFKPLYTRIAEEIHKLDRLAHYHTCGYTLQILPDLIECGFDEINPQVPTMDIHRIAAIFRDRACIRPDLERQGVLMRGSPQDVAAHVLDTFAILKSNRGGYVAHIPIEVNLPVENVEAMMNAYRDCNFNNEAVEER
jgi:uroporphyrinogen decarboxylase